MRRRGVGGAWNNPRPKNGLDLAAAPRARAAAGAVLVEEEEVCVVARALGAARSARRVCAVVRAAHVLEARNLEARVLAREKAAPKALHLGDERRAVGDRAAGHGIGPARLGAGDRDGLEQAVGVVGRLAESAERDAGDADLAQPP